MHGGRIEMNFNLDKKKVVLGLSGGVDSAIAALLLKKQGYDVTGLYFDISKDNKEGIEAARKTAKEAGIDFVYKNVHKNFYSVVVDNFCNEYISGRTPNPCIICNPNIKFKTLIDYADSIGAYYIATGHYGSTCYDKTTESWYIKRGKNIKKDQTYMLYRLPQETIARFLMPLENLETKDETRKIADDAGMSSAYQKDSQEICFIPDNSTYLDLLKDRGYRATSGNFIDLDGNVIGAHQGIVNFTVGQRKGLGMTFGKPMFVLKLDNNNNTVTLGDNCDLFSNIVYSKNNFFTSTGLGALPKCFDGIEVDAKIRYAAKPAKAVIRQVDEDTIESVFTEPQRAATPGQSIVFYYGDMVIGGGFIE